MKVKLREKNNEKVLIILQKHEHMWEFNLREINGTEYQTDILPNTKHLKSIS